MSTNPHFERNREQHIFVPLKADFEAIKMLLLIMLANENEKLTKATDRAESNEKTNLKLMILYCTRAKEK